MRFRKKRGSFRVRLTCVFVGAIYYADRYDSLGGKKIEKKNERTGNTKINLFVQDSVIVEKIIPIKLYGLFDLKSVLYS